MNKIEELILDFVDAWGFKLSGKISDEDMLSEEKNKNMTKDLKEVIQQAVEEERERCANIVDITRKSFVLGIYPQRDHALKVAAKAIRNKK